WDIQINYGIKTGYNEAFIIDGKKKDELIAEDPKSAEIIRPILRGRDIKRYGYEFADLWLLYIPWHFPLHKDPKIIGASVKAEKAFQAEYSAIYNHLFKFKAALLNRNKAETGIRYEWYAMQRWGANYWEDFFRPKIIYPNMTKFLPFVYDEDGFFTNQKCFIVTGEHIAYLTAFFNSSLFKYAFRDNFPELQGGTRELSKIFFDKIPIKQVDARLESSFRNLVIQIQELRRQSNDSKQLEVKVDELIFDLYQLTYEERQLIGFIEIK
ncbi:MAG: TaqI-like C-terminal specificity domain-containing protein, partial [Candidatus Omnitrophota bacterium]